MNENVQFNKREKKSFFLTNLILIVGVKWTRDSRGLQKHREANRSSTFRSETSDFTPEIRELCNSE